MTLIKASFRSCSRFNRFSAAAEFSCRGTPPTRGFRDNLMGMAGTRIQSLGKVIAAVSFVAIVAALGVYISHQRKHSGGKDKPGLRPKMTQSLSNVRYSHEVGGVVRFVLTAGTDRAYEDGSHELEQVKLESHGTDGTRDDTVTADKAKVSNTADTDNLDAEFISNVNVVTTEGLILKTDYLKYDAAKNTVETADPVEFKRDNLHGKCVGLLLEAGPERAHLLHQVDATLEPASGEKPGAAKGADNKASSGKRAGPENGRSQATAQSQKQETPEEIAARKERKRQRKLERQKAREAAAQPRARPKPSDQIAEAQSAEPQQRKKGATLSKSPKEPVHVTCESALLEKKEHRVTFTGSVLLTQGIGQMKADNMLAMMDDKNQVQKIEARGNCDLAEQERGEVAAPSIDFYFDAEGKELEHAEGTGGVYAKSLGGDPLREAWSDSAEVFFVNSDSGNNIDTIKGHGHARLHMNAPPPKSPKDNPAERLLTSGELMLKFFPDGKNLERADADKDATIVITPTRAERGADKKTIRAPRMNALFYLDPNAVKSFDASGGVHCEMDAMWKDQRAHPPRITTSRTLSATFTSDSQDIDKVVQDGEFKYEEGDRHGAADRATYYGQTQLLTLRGHRPMGWDTKDRLQADEIDYDNDKDETHARGDVRTTYYNPDSTNKSTPMQNSKSPIFVTADRADSRNDDSMAVYTGNAHGWQDDNFIKADRLELYQDEKRMVAVGHVESEMYKIERQTSPGHKEIVPAFATSERMTYNDATRLIHYEGNVKSRQDTDRVNGDSVDIYLHQDTNEVDHVIATGNVELIQPERHGWGDHLLYTSDDGKAVLTGKTARVIDEEKGSTMGSELTFYSRDDRIFVDNRYGTGRVRSTHRMERGKEKR